MIDNNESEELAYHQNSTGAIAHTCDDNIINLVNEEEEQDFKSIQSISVTNDISMNDDETFIHKYYAPFLPSNNNEDVSSGSEFDSEKQILRCNKNIILDLLLDKSNIFKWQLSFLFFVLNNRKLSPYIAHISKQINF